MPAVERKIIYGVWFKEMDRGQADPTKKPVGGLWEFLVEANVANYFGMTTYDMVEDYVPPLATEDSIVGVRGYEAVKTYQLDPLTAPSGTSKKVEGYSRLAGAAPSGYKKNRGILIPTKEKYIAKVWNNATQQTINKEKIRHKSFQFPGFFTKSMVQQFVGCIITKKYPERFKFYGGKYVPMKRFTPGRFHALTVGAWPITKEQYEKGLQAQSLTEAVPDKTRRRRSRRVQKA